MQGRTRVFASTISYEQRKFFRIILRIFLPFQKDKTFEKHYNISTRFLMFLRNWTNLLF